LALWIESRDLTAFPAGKAWLPSVVISQWRTREMPFDTLTMSFLGAAVFSLFLAVNHRRDRKVAV